jgi:hypothetical protein
VREQTPGGGDALKAGVVVAAAVLDGGTSAPHRRPWRCVSGERGGGEAQNAGVVVAAAGS